MLNPTLMMRGARISTGARYAEPTVEVRFTSASALAILKKSICGTIFRVPKRNAREIRRSTLVTFGKRSSPRLLRNTIWLARVRATPAVAASARDTENVDTYG